MIRNVNNPFFLFLRLFLKTFIKNLILYRKGYRVEGKDHLPEKRKPCIIICNHAALVDSVYIICAVKPRFTICGARPNYFSTTIKRFVLRLGNVIKVENRQQFLDDCEALLKAGEVILIYPEMGRNPRGLSEFKQWAAEVALANRVPVIPCYLYGTSDGHEGKKRFFVGRAINPEGNPETLTRTFYDEIENLQKQNIKAE